MPDLPTPEEFDEIVGDLEEDDSDLDETQRQGLEDLERRCAAANLTSTWGEDRASLKVAFPNGREHRLVDFTPNRLTDIDDVPIERLTFLGDYQAIWDPDEDVIEARFGGMGDFRLWRNAAGIEVLAEDGSWSTKPQAERERGSYSAIRGPSWRIKVEKGPTAIEISPTSTACHVLCQPGRSVRGRTLKISGTGASNHDDALTVLNDLGQAFLFDIDLRYDVPIQLLRHGRRVAVRRAARLEAPPQFPSNRYAAEPIALYQYGREASGLPLLQFLAFYQVLEFFFPVFTREEGIKQLRNRLQDPRFEVSDDVALGSLLTSLGATRPGAEREQLRIVLKRCFDEKEIRDFIEESSLKTEHFCANKQAIRGAGKISLSSGAADLRDQVADRIYAIRCRIVHTKQDGGQAAVELLLPSSREVRSLRPDVDLVLHAAQRAIVAAAGRRS